MAKTPAEKKPAAKKPAKAKAAKKPAAKKTAAKKDAELDALDTSAAEASAAAGADGNQPESQPSTQFEGQGPLLQILAQYTRDASFENPNAPDSLRSNLEAPKIDLNVEVKGSPPQDNTAEVSLLITARATRGADVAFICELEYSGLFAFANVPVDQLQALMLIECPRILFPFARKILSDMTQDGGFPPLMLEPLDFAALYRQQHGANQTIN